MQNKKGFIELIIGPMFSGKSTQLINIFNRYKKINKNILLINHPYNKRYDSDQIMTHNNYFLQNCLITDDLLSLQNTTKYIMANIIIIEELQFFNNAYEFITYAADNDNKYIIAAGLNGDYKRNIFGDMYKLIAHADKIKKLSALCIYCNDGTKAHFTLKKTNNDKILEVGENNIYEAVCRKHYLLYV